MRNKPPVVTVVKFITGIACPRKKKGQKRVVVKPLKYIEDINQVIDKKWVLAGLAFKQDRSQELPLLCPANYGANVLRYLLPSAMNAHAANYSKIESNPVITWLFQYSSVEQKNSIY